MGVWIETAMVTICSTPELSHPAWVCGLKLTALVDDQEQMEVTPCVGVWIETVIFPWACCFSMSHPAWVCGLKQLERGTIATDWKSHPAWVCGLKPSTVNLTIPCFGHTLRGCVD